jgi:hypothetical protein
MSASPTVIVYNLGWMDNLVNARNWRLNKTISNQLKVHAFLSIKDKRSKASTTSPYFPSRKKYKRKDHGRIRVNVNKRRDEHVSNTDDWKRSQHKGDQHAQPKCQPVQLS